MNNKIISIKTTSAIFLAIVLVTGTITALSIPSLSMIEANAQGQPYYEIDNRYNSYEPQYPSYKPDYKPQYPSDNFKPKYSSYEKNPYKKDVSINKLKCINNNININGNNTGDVSIGNKGQVANANAAEGYLGAYSSGNGEGYYDDGYNNNNKKDKGFDCIINNNNNNTNIGIGDGNQTIPQPEPLTATLNVSKVLECVPFQTLPNYLEACDRILNEIAPNQFNFAVIGNNSNPSQFDGSSVGINVKMNPGNYIVSETIDQSVSTTLTDISNDLGVVIQQDLNVGITGDCDEIVVGGVEVGVGTIAEGESQECRVFNEFLVGIENE